MAKPQPIIHGETEVRPMSDPRSWARSNGTHISGRAYIDGADETACEMEAKWGADRLRLLVGPELREKFDRQRYLFNQAIWHGDLEQVRREAGRMTTAWLALDKAATAAGKQPLHPQVWEVAAVDPVLSDDDPTRAAYVIAIVPDNASARHVIAEGRKVTVYTMEEIGRILANYPELAKVKNTFPGATITAVRRSVDDPLDAIADSKVGLDDPVEDIYA